MPSILASPHATYILAAYGVWAAALVVLGCHIVRDRARRRQKLAMLERGRGA